MIEKDKVLIQHPHLPSSNMHPQEILITTPGFSNTQTRGGSNIHTREGSNIHTQGFSNPRFPALPLVGSSIHMQVSEIARPIVQVARQGLLRTAMGAFGRACKAFQSVLANMM
jgi:hypothetical protein